MWGWGEEKAGRENKCDRGAENVTKKKVELEKKARDLLVKKGRKTCFVKSVEYPTNVGATRATPTATPLVVVSD